MQQQNPFRRGILLRLVALLPLISFQGCKVPSSFGARDPLNAGVGYNPPMPTEIRDKCTDPRVIKVTGSETLMFAENTNTCSWNVGGNLPAINGRVNARHETFASLQNLPSGAALCNIDLTFGSPGSFGFGSPLMYFDDALMLTFNDAILISSDNWAEKSVLASEGPMLFYDWSLMAGLSDRGPGKFRNLYGACAGIPEDCSTYCIGKNADPALDTECQMPPESPTAAPDIADNMYLRIKDPEVLYSLAKRAVDLDRFDFSLVSFGDNDSKDCKHGGLSVEILYTYIP